jgi:hypothetical protein
VEVLLETAASMMTLAAWAKEVLNRVGMLHLGRRGQLDTMSVETLDEWLCSSCKLGSVSRDHSWLGDVERLRVWVVLWGEASVRRAGIRLLWDGVARVYDASC